MTYRRALERWVALAWLPLALIVGASVELALADLWWASAACAAAAVVALAIPPMLET